MSDTMDATGVAVRADGLRKRIRRTEAVKDVSFEVPFGSVFGLIGRNGAGKTTTIRLLLGLLRPDAGRSEVLGDDSLALSKGVRRRIGYLSEDSFPYDDLSLPRTLEFVSAFFPDWSWDLSERLMERLAVPSDTPLSALSAGERRKAELLLVLAQDPDLLILDDPAAGLDTVVRRDFLWAALEVARDEGKAVLFTSHVLTDVERVADTVAFLDQGTILFQTALDDLKAKTKRIVVGGAAQRGDPIAVPGEILRRSEKSDLVVVTTEFDPVATQALRASYGEVLVEDLNLEDIFVEVLGNAPKAAQGSVA
jgi:ABC-2 type transport system ATP-binding protein